MSRLKYARHPRSYLPQRRRWWLALPLPVLVLAALLGSRLAGDGGLLITPAGCPGGDDCAPAIVASSTCAVGGACLAAEEQPAIEADTGPGAIFGLAAAVIEEPCGGSLFQFNPHRRLAPASLTKIATALVALEGTDPSEMVDVRVDGGELSAATDSTVMGLEAGQRLSMGDLLYGLLLPSGNDAAIAIAEHVAGGVPAFVRLMNGKAARLGLTDTRFTNPHGLDDPGLYTSALDIATLGRELLRQPELANIVRTPTYQPSWDGPLLWNGNRLLQLYPGSLGVKTGFTDEAGQTIVAAAERDGRRILLSVLGSSDVYRDSIMLFDWAFDEAPSVCEQRP